MQVETFECAETAAEPIEASEEAIRLIDEMGLKGQSALLSKQDGKRDSRCPYREIRADERFVYRTICPQETEIDRYSVSPIPLRVLQIASHARSLGLFKRMTVWSQEDATVKDPVLVASTGGYDWETGSKTFILARWGEELETFAVLLKRACSMAREHLQQKAREFVGLFDAISDSELMSRGPNRNLDW